jgi:hypothetical protein
MKIAAVVSLLAFLASAQLSPVNILNEMPDTEELVCKGIKFKGLDIKNAIRLAVHLNHTGAVHHNKGGKLLRLQPIAFCA